MALGCIEKHFFSDPAVVVGDADLVLGPVVRNVTELCSGLVAVVIEAGGDGGDLGAGDVVLRADLTVAVTDDIGEVIRRVFRPSASSSGISTVGVEGVGVCFLAKVA